MAKVKITQIKSIIDRPESVEVKHLLIPRSSGFHLKVRLITDAVINKIYMDWR